MEIKKRAKVVKESTKIHSVYLDRFVLADFYLPTEVADPSQMSLLMVNDGQDMEKLGLMPILDELYTEEMISPLFIVAIHAGKDRKMEYGTAGQPDYKGRGAKAQAYTDFIFKELLPYIHKTYLIHEFKEKAFAGFSLGGLSAIDMVWKKPSEFSKVGVFSGSLWWRARDQKDAHYNDDLDRIMHQEIRKGVFSPWLKFFFECGTEDEKEDRNQNGIIDSIDDTMDLIKELVAKGYDADTDIEYLEIENGKHDVATWGIAMPEFLKWGWGRVSPHC